MRTRTLRRTLVLGLALAALCPALYAQTGAASITGIVTDATGAAAPGVTVTAVNQATIEIPTFAPAVNRCPARASCRVSRLNAENVVKPPQMPVMTKWRWRGPANTRPSGAVNVA